MNIKRIIVLTLVFVLFVTCMTSCKKDEGENGAGAASAQQMCTVKFNTNCDAVIEPKSILKGEKIGEPDILEYEGFVFDGWYDGNIKWNFAFDKVEGDMTLTAKWLSPENVFKYEIMEDGTAEITGVKNEARYIQIPSEIGGYSVTKIADEAFSQSSSETYMKITLPESVTVIGKSAFENCADISIEVRGALKRVEEWAFAGCNGLTGVTFAEDVELIAPESFKSSGLTFLYIPESFKVIDETVFSGCVNLQRVMLHANSVSILDSAFRDTGVKTLYLYGTESDVDSLFADRIEEKYNDSILDAAVYIYSETEPDGETKYDGYWYFDGKGQTRIWS